MPISTHATYPQFSMEHLATTEILRWYDLFYAWSRGLVPKEERYVRSIYDALASDFHVVLTTGIRMSREMYWTRLYDLHAERSCSPRSTLDSLQLKPAGSGHTLAVFELLKEGSPDKKINTALLRVDDNAPCGVTWVHVHESLHETSKRTEIIAQHRSTTLRRRTSGR